MLALALALALPLAVALEGCAGVPVAVDVEVEEACRELDPETDVFAVPVVDCASELAPDPCALAEPDIDPDGLALG